MSGAWVRGECRLSTGTKVVLKYTLSLSQPTDIPTEATYPPVASRDYIPSFVFTERKLVLHLTRVLAMGGMITGKHYLEPWRVRKRGGGELTMWSTNLLR